MVHECFVLQICFTPYLVIRMCCLIVTFLPSVADPQFPSINIYGGERTGETTTVVCSAFHTCPYSKPTITLNGIEGSDHTDNEHFKDGLWKITLTRTGVVKIGSSTIDCSVIYHGGITVTATKDKNARCKWLMHMSGFLQLWSYWIIMII